MPRPFHLLVLFFGLSACVELDVSSPKDPALVQRIQELETKRRATPNDPMVILELAMVMQATGDLFGAAEVLKGASEQNPESPELMLGLHRIYTELGYGLAAFKILEGCVQKHPRHPECIYRMATFLLLQDGSEDGMKKARELFVRFLEVAPDHPQGSIVRDALARMEETMGPLEGGVPSSQPATPGAADPHAAPADKLGAHQGADGQEVGALNPFGQAIAEAMRAADRQDAPAAEAAFRRALEFQPGDGIAMAGLAESLFTQGKLAESVDAIEKAYASSPDEPIVQFVFGVVMVKGRKDVTRGVEAWEKLRRAQPDYAQKLGVPRMIEDAKRPPAP